MYIIFDFDGVIMDTEKSIFKFFQKELLKRGIDLPDSKYPEKVGNSSEKFLKTVTNLSDKEISDLANLRRSEFMKHMDYYVLIDGVKEEIIRLSKNNRLALCSNSPLNLLKAVIAYHELDKYFEFILGMEDVRMLKPDPEIYNLAKSRFALKFNEHITKDNCFVIEDSLFGVTAAKEANLKVIAITTSFSRNQLAHADFVIDKFKELSTIIR